MVKVTDQLMVQIPEFINKPEKDTHLFLMPPYTYSKIVTNKQTTLSLGVSLESQLNSKTKAYELVRATHQMIDLVNN